MYDAPTETFTMTAIAQAIAASRRPPQRFKDAYDDLPFSLKSSYHILLEMDEVEALKTTSLNLGEELLARTESVVLSLGGASEVHFTEDGHPYRVGGSEKADRIDELADALRDYLQQAWIAHDLLKAKGVMAALGGSQHSDD